MKGGTAMRTSSVGPARDTTFRGQSKRAVVASEGTFQQSSSMLQQQPQKKKQTTKKKRTEQPRATKKQKILPNIHTDPNAALLQAQLHAASSKLLTMSKHRRAIHGYETSI